MNFIECRKHKCQEVQGKMPINIYFLVFKGTWCVCYPWRAVHPCSHDQKLTLTVSKICINGSNFVCDALFQPSDNVRFVYIQFVFQVSPKNVVAPRNIRFGWLGNMIKMCNNVFWKCDCITVLWFICVVLCGWNQSPSSSAAAAASIYDVSSISYYHVGVMLLYSWHHHRITAQ